MDQQVRGINVKYGLNLTEEEIQRIAREAEATARVLQALHQVDLGTIRPIQVLTLRPSASRRMRGRR
jgi:hypothetical protein